MLFYLDGCTFRVCTYWAIEVLAVQIDSCTPLYTQFQENHTVSVAIEPPRTNLLHSVLWYEQHDNVKELTYVSAEREAYLGTLRFLLDLLRRDDFTLMILAMCPIATLHWSWVPFNTRGTQQQSVYVCPWMLNSPSPFSSLWAILRLWIRTTSISITNISTSDSSSLQDHDNSGVSDPRTTMKHNTTQHN